MEKSSFGTSLLKFSFSVPEKVIWVRKDMKVRKKGYNFYFSLNCSLFCVWFLLLISALGRGNRLWNGTVRFLRSCGSNSQQNKWVSLNCVFHTSWMKAVKWVERKSVIRYSAAFTLCMWPRTKQRNLAVQSRSSVDKLWLKVTHSSLYHSSENRQTIFFSISNLITHSTEY